MSQDPTQKSDEYWKEKLNNEQFEVCRRKGTEAPFSGNYYDNHEPGVYECVACGQELFSSGAKFDSDTGWPSFYDAMKKENVELKEDETHGMRRTEVLCRTCQSHLGHVFDDGPTPTGKRYCINSVALKFKKKS